MAAVYLLSILCRRWTNCRDPGRSRPNDRPVQTHRSGNRSQETRVLDRWAERNYPDKNQGATGRKTSFVSARTFTNQSGPKPPGRRTAEAAVPTLFLLTP